MEKKICKNGFKRDKSRLLGGRQASAPSAGAAREGRGTTAVKRGLTFFFSSSYFEISYVLVYDISLRDQESYRGFIIPSTV